MPADYQRIRQRIQAFDFKGLFTQELMWNHLQTRELQIPLDGVIYTLLPVAERGMAVYICVPPSDAAFPKYPTRRKIDVQISKTAREHIIIFHDAAKTVQIWQWVKREAGKPSACREQIYYAGQSADALTQKVQAIQFSLDDEPSVLETRVRVSAAFDVEKVTKKFYEQFKKEHDAFLKFIKGILEEHLKRWYVSVMLNRLMFIYFIQKKRFLAGDQNYLASRLAESKKRGKDIFYGKFLCPLFFEGFAKREEQRSPEINRLLGNIPYLNGGLFLKHQIEDLHGETIEVPDRAFERIFEFFDRFDWLLDDRPTRTGREINPDVLGYVFEKYINQKEMGAYYTKEDITGYISQNTIIPALFDMARKSCRIAFEGDHAVWRLLKQDPDRYIYPATLHGVDKELPINIATGISEVSKRVDWNKTATPDLGLPTETWRETVARRERCAEIRNKLAAGEIQTISDLITSNLDIRRFAEEVISNAEGPELLRAFYTAIAGSKTKSALSVLDPACGSGAFLFAALNILERTYDACLSRMQAFVDDLDRSSQKHGPEKYSDFRSILGEMNDKARHPSPRYFILKSIILNNLYGVDIMEEATEICKLRLFLKLVAQVNPGEKIEPLPDIDFNVRAGNTLIGFTSRNAVVDAIHTKLAFDDTIQSVEERAEHVETAFREFRDMQMRSGMGPHDFFDAKADLQKRLEELRLELDGYLAGEYGVKSTIRPEFALWRTVYHPFHWFVEFFGIMQEGGFDVIVGNPPFVEYRKVRSQYTVKGFITENTANLYAFMMERSTFLLQSSGHLGLIVPIAAISVTETKTLREVMMRQFSSLWLSNYAIRPAKLFEGVEQRLTIVIAQGTHRADARIYSTKYNQWYADERPFLFHKLAYCDVTSLSSHGSFPKIGDALLLSVISKIHHKPAPVIGELLVSDSTSLLFFHRTPGYWIRIMDFEPYFKSPTHDRSIHHIRELRVRNKMEASLIGAVVSSSLYFAWFFAIGNCRNLTLDDVKLFPLGQVSATNLTKIARIFDALMADYQKNSAVNRRGTTEFQEFDWGASKHIVDQIDNAIGSLYALSEAELDYIVNYDIKIRLGRHDTEEEAEEMFGATGAGET